MKHNIKTIIGISLIAIGLILSINNLKPTGFIISNVTNKFSYVYIITITLMILGLFLMMSGRREIIARGNNAQSLTKILEEVDVNLEPDSKSMGIHKFGSVVSIHQNIPDTSKNRIDIMERILKIAQGHETSGEEKDLEWEYWEKGKKQGININLKTERKRTGFWGIPKKSVSHINLNLKAKSLQDRLAEIKGIETNEEGGVEKAIRDYRKVCIEKIGILPHRSSVHSFGDTIKQAIVLAIPGKNEKEKYNLTLMTLYSHLFDDLIDPQKGLERSLGHFQNYQDIERKLPEKTKRVAERMLELSKRKKGIRELLMGMIYGGLIQQAQNKNSQGKILQKYQKEIVNKTKDFELKRALTEMHPSLIGLAVHVGMEGIFGLEEGNQEVGDTATAYNLFYAPMLYYHDRDKEKAKEGAKIRYGKRELCGLRGYIKDKELVKLLDTFDTHIRELPDSRRKEHIKQAQIVYKSFRPVLSRKMRKRYEQSLGRLAA